ncbi:MAG TPA: 4Fe-4S dicluster domain-containing protein [Candidatus Ruthenibacterium merdigallinarum]|nr:4Fe-4S dicluster domain-containing protein [Candidatus Ruthenibacterium merdigallinarum]
MERPIIHSVTLDRDACKGCINCIKRCPTEAIRVRDGKAAIISERCVDCGECIRICPHHAKRAVSDPLDVLERYAYSIALPPPSLYAQFNNLDDPDMVLAGLLQLGFDSVFEVSRAAELISEATRRLLQEGSLPRPVISSACPAVTRLICVRFPQLIGHVLPLLSPMELAARMAKAEAAQKTGLAPEQIGCVFITPCPAKVSAVRAPLGSEKSAVDAAVAVKDVYPKLLGAMKKVAHVDYLAGAGRIGLGWGESGGEAAGLMVTERYLAADGVENVIRVLSDLEDEKYPNLDFVELNACAGGCVGGVLQVENPYIAKAKMKHLRRTMPVSLNHLTEASAGLVHWDKALAYNPVMELGATNSERFARYARMEELTAALPGLDCGSCGAPTCEALAEDIVRGTARLDDCTVLMRRRMEAVLRALGKDGTT